MVFRSLELLTVYVGSKNICIGCSVIWSGSCGDPVTCVERRRLPVIELFLGRGWG